MVEKQKKNITDAKSRKPEDIVSQISQAIKDIHDQINDDLKLLQTEFSKLSSINYQLQADLKQYKQNNEQLTQEISDIQTENNKQLELLRKEITDLEKQAENRINTLETQINFTDEKNRTLQEELDSANNTIQDLESEKAEIIQTKDQIFVEKDEIADRLNDLDREHKKLVKTHNAYKRRKGVTVNKLREENKKLKGDLKSAEDLQNQINREYSKEREKCKDLLNENEMLKSDKGTLIFELDQVDERIKNELEQSLLDIVTQLSEHLSKLSVLAGEEPQEVKGLKIETVYRDLLDWITNLIGERPRSFPETKDCDEDGTLWLDADEIDLKLLVEKYDWSNTRPFENLPEGDRTLPFSVMRRGWQVKGTVIKRAKINLINID